MVGLVVTRPEVGFRAHLVTALTKALIRRGSVPILINTGHTEAELLAELLDALFPPGTKAVSVADIYRACGSLPAVLR